MTEILAPAGSFDALVAAVRCGADAVYLGGKAFNARRNASNFSREELKKAVDYCHSRNVKVYVTLNTLISDGELETAYKEIESICLAGADAFVVQDPGVARLVKEICPSMALHASTQMSVQSKYGVRLLEEQGFSRVVVPRELSEKEIKNISADSDIEIEYFVHGALCMCVSGQCLMSSMLGGRSGNRGLCAQPCRLPFGVNSKGGHNLSLKDLSLIDRIPSLEKAGVDSLKIEGRMKRPEYVAAAVTACKNAINNTPDKSVTDALGAVFSRSGFTSGYFDGRLGRDMFGIRTKENVESSSSVLDTLSHLYDNENSLLPVNMTFTLKRGEYPVLSAEYDEYEARVVSEVMASDAVSKEVTADDVRGRLSKCGGTQFYCKDVKCDIDAGLNLPASVINGLRRDVLSSLEKKIAERPEAETRTFRFEKKEHFSRGRKLYVRFLDEESIPDNLTGVDRAVIPLDTSDKAIERLVSQGIEVASEIPVNVFSNGEKYIEELKRHKSLGVSLAVADNYDGIEIAKLADMPFSAGFGTNIYNSVSLDFFEKLGAVDCLISCENSLSEISHLGGDIPRGIIVYGRIPLMVTRNCPVKNKLNCRECNRESELVDRMGIRFPVRCKYGCSYILNSRPVCMYDRRNEIRNTDFDLLYFTTESKEECVEIIREYKEGKHPSYEYTRGLYNRTVL